MMEATAVPDWMTNAGFAQERLAFAIPMDIFIAQVIINKYIQDFLMV